MSTTKESDERNPYIGGRVDPIKKRKAEMRAKELGMNMQEYINYLISEDLEGVEYLEHVEFE